MNKIEKLVKELIAPMDSLAIQTIKRLGKEKRERQIEWKEGDECVCMTTEAHFKAFVSEFKKN